MGYEKTFFTLLRASTKDTLDNVITIEEYLDRGYYHCRGNSYHLSMRSLFMGIIF